MKYLTIHNRLIIWVDRYMWSWLGYSLTWDYHNIIGSITILTLNFGFEYVRPESNLSIEKRSYGWDLIRLG